MLRSGDWIHPALHHGIPHYTKPPLTYWTIAASVGLLGRNEWAVRLPNSIAYLASLIVVLAIGRTVNRRNPWLPVLIYATSLLTFITLSSVSTDTELVLFETLAMFAFVRGWFEKPQEPVRWIRLMWGAFGLAFMTKGPPGLLPLVAIVAFVILTSGPAGLRRVFDGIGIAIFLALGGRGSRPWFSETPICLTTS